jgi:glucose-6-phosphate isomerase
MTKLDQPVQEKSFFARLGRHQAAVETSLTELRDHRILARIWAHDHTVWKPDPTEISNRLGWLHSPEVMADAIPTITELVDAVRRDGFTHALLLGMGGSSLAPEVFRKTFGVAENYLDLAVLDSTDPGAVRTQARRLDPAKTLFIVSTKSGGTVETLSFFKYFYNLTAEAVGSQSAGQHFIAITDPGSKLAEIADEYHFRTTFLNDPNIGGRYSALSYFGLVPAALVGVDLHTLLDRAATMARNCKSGIDPVAGDNRGAWLGAILGELAGEGHDKVTLITSPPIAAFGAWVEQLIAESTGKEGKGILPVDGEALGPPQIYGDDRLFVYLRLEGDNTPDPAVQTLADAGHPVVWLHLSDRYDLGGEFFRWQMATVIAGWRLGINPFDQPNVEAAKVQARKMVAAYQETGSLPEPAPTLEADGITVYSDTPADSLADALNTFLATARAGDYAALQAYIQPSEAATAALQRLRMRIRDRLKLATTVGYGPRFLHSTGQLHKGDSGNGLFIQLTADPAEDVPIPDRAGSPESSITFGVLIKAQALGDRQALLDNGRRVIRFHLGSDAVTGIERLTRALA